MNKFNTHFQKLAALCKRHKFIIENTVDTKTGPSAVYEFGPLGVELRRNFRLAWWQDVVTRKESIYGVEIPVFDTVKNRQTAELQAQKSTEKGLHDKPHGLLDAGQLFDDVFSLELQDKEQTRDLLLQLMSKNTVPLKTRNNGDTGVLSRTSALGNCQVKLPVGYAWNEKVVSMTTNENNFLRNMEEEIICLQFLCKPKTSKYWLNFWRRERLVWWRKFANVPSNFLTNETQKSQENSGIKTQYGFPWGNEDIESFKYWSEWKCFDDHLKVIPVKSSDDSPPQVLHITTNLDRGFIALLADAFEEKERAGSDGHVATRNVLHFHPNLAPIKVAIFSNNQEKNELSEVSIQLASELRQAGISTSSEWESTSPEEFYAYYDEIGTPYCIIILESTLNNGVVALRNRDTTLQEFLHISDVLNTLESHLKHL